VQVLQSLADNKCRRLRSIIICLHVIFITSVFTIIYKRGAGSQIDILSKKNNNNNKQSFPPYLSSSSF
jgi:hypothetical protein